MDFTLPRLRSAGRPVNSGERFTDPARRVGAIAIMAGSILLAGIPTAGQAATSEAIDRAALRVCADPNNMPFSNEAGEGFENKIAELIAAELGVPVQYTWYPNTVGFIRNTLRARKCDLVLAAPTASELLQNTNPYYRSTYALIYRKDSGLTATSLSDPVMKSLRIGVVAGTPPATLIAKYSLFDQMRPYHLMVDTRFESATARMIDDVSSGEVDVGLLWGPIAGYHAKTHNPSLVMVPIDPHTENGTRVDFRIHMGLRYNEPEWKH
ncbi:MAG: quinoprotein dehydrogenase-associated putative ABC transporter substrate-binding protein, partial [Acidimicrobiia bacterium]|nr:quinoprotein dehydrogenase-associated putative ABC transporter substrate-binding protein [Acidimicrobiia bacterium]